MPLDIVGAVSRHHHDHDEHEHHRRPDVKSRGWGYGVRELFIGPDWYVNADGRPVMFLAKVTGNGLVAGGPSLSSAGQIWPVGTLLQVLRTSTVSEGASWWYVRTPNGTYGYILSSEVARVAGEFRIAGAPHDRVGHLSVTRFPTPHYAGYGPNASFWNVQHMNAGLGFGDLRTADKPWSRAWSRVGQLPEMRSSTPPSHHAPPPGTPAARAFYAFQLAVEHGQSPQVIERLVNAYNALAVEGGYDTLAGRADSKLTRLFEPSHQPARTHHDPRLYQYGPFHR